MGTVVQPYAEAAAENIPGPLGLLRREMCRVRDDIGCAAMCWGALDPETWLPASHAHDTGSRTHLDAVWHNEFAEDDVNKFRQLARSRSHVGLLSLATGGDVERSARYRTIFRRLGFEHELRATLVVRGEVWGYVSLLRGPERRDFTPAETRRLAGEVQHLATALRHALGAAPCAIADDDPALGMLVLGRSNALLASTPAAEPMLDELGYGIGQSARLPEAVHALAAAVRAGATDACCSTRVRGERGRWLKLRGTRLRPSAGDDCQVAITLEPARTSEVAPLVLAGNDLSRREREIALLVVRGFNTGEISTQLCISPYTVQDHLKAIFDKVQVRSRQALVASLFYSSNGGVGSPQATADWDGRPPAQLVLSSQVPAAGAHAYSDR